MPENFDIFSVFFKNVRTLKFNPRPTVYPFLLRLIILADLSGNRSSLQLSQKVTSVGCDWYISIHFVFHFSLAVAMIMIDGSKINDRL